MLRLIFLLLLVVFSSMIYGQEMPGMTMSNYQAYNSALINPSAPLHAKTYLDVNLFGLDLFIDNTSANIPGKGFAWYDLLKSGYEMPKYGPYERPLEVNTSSPLHRAYVSQRLMLPGFVYIDRTISYGLFLSHRTVVSARRVPYEMVNFGYYDLSYTPQQSMLYHDYDIRIAGLSWSEVGFNFAKTVKYKRFSIVNAGITLKRLYGAAAAFATVDDIKYIVYNDSTIDIKNIRGKLAFSGPLDYQSNEYDSDAGPFTGSGFSIDLGVTFIKTKKEVSRIYSGPACAWQFIPYDYRLGLSLLDIGYIRFNENAQVHTFENSGHYWEEFNKFQPDNISDALREVSQRLYGDAEKSLTDSSFTALLPSAFSAQFDYHLKNNYYINTLLVQDLPIPGSYRAPRESYLSVTPRYETRAFEANLPFIFYDWRRPRVGLSLRFYSFTIGTDKLGTWLGMGDVYGMDIYLSLRLAWLKGFCKVKKEKHPCGEFQF
jgi:hypothetical protein